MEGRLPKRTCEEAEKEEVVTVEVKKPRYDIFDTLDDVEADVDLEVSELASVMMSFEEEIGGVVVEAEEESVKDLSIADIGWLLEASDDELGLPTTVDVKVNDELCLPPCATEEVAVGGWEIEPLEFGGGEWVGFDDVFGYQDTAAPSDFSE